MQLHDALSVARRGWIVILVCVLVGLALAGWRASQIDPSYVSRVQVFMRGNAVDTRERADAANVAVTRVPSYAELARGNELATRVATRLDLEPSALTGKVQAEAMLNTVLVNISVSDPDAALSEAIAGAAAEELTGLVEELETPEGESEPIVVAEVVGQPSAATSVAPDGRRTLALGGLLGLLAGFGIAVLRDRITVRRLSRTASSSHA